ncbi:hypothetical protein B0H34DRAFT_698545 [Crassisporium funariophilum]|nr:hypothetical protein B0H34DRAFT_698545 [Crassisporium funariophilum]
MSSDVLANFGCLDELTQVIYQSIYKFVVLSTVSSDKWNIHIGLAGSEGRWWQGSWSEEDISRIFGSKTSDKLLESFAEKLAETFIEGELCISDWSADKGAKIKITFGPSAKKPLHMPLVEMSPEDAAEHATKVFIDIAVQAQSRKCRLYPQTAEYSSSVPPLPVHTTKHSKRKESSPESHSRRTALKQEAAPSTSHKLAKKPSASELEVKAAQEEIKSLKSQIERQKQIASPIQRPLPAAVSRPHKGASLANPNKKARKYQAIEFESDDE